LTMDCACVLAEKKKNIARRLMMNSFNCKIIALNI
jgi:hypothetical protein